MGVEKKSGIYIPDTKIPDGDYVRVLMLYKDGTCVDGIGNVFKVIPVPPHGRLIDADALFETMERMGWYDNADRDIAEDIVFDSPTIIPAKDGE